MHRLAALALLAALIDAGCGGGAEPTTTSRVPPVTSTTVAAATTAASSPTTTTVATTSTTTTSTTTTTTTTISMGVTVCPLPVALPEGTLVFAGGSGDFDGDGTSDDLLTYQVAADNWRLRVIFADGGGADATIEDVMDFAPPRPIGGFDIDGDGTAEAFLTVGAGASTTHVGIFDVAACVVTPVTVNGAHTVFPVGASVGAVSGLSCAGDGIVRRTFAQRTDETTFAGGYEDYTVTGSDLVSQQVVTDALTEEQAGVLGQFDCGGLTLP